MRFFLRVVVAGLVAALLAGDAGAPGRAIATYTPVAAPLVPGQFVAKMYTEALGRAPTQAEWQYWIGYL